MRRRPPPKSGLLMTIGILSIIFGCLYAVWGMCGFMQGAMRTAIGPKQAGPFNVNEFLAHMKREVPYWIEIDVAHSASGLLLAVFLIVVGIGMLGRKGWSRWLGAVASLAFILSQILFAVYY